MTRVRDTTLAFRGVDEVAGAIRMGEISAVDVTSSCIEMIDSFAEQFGVFTRVLAEEAMEVAAARDRDRARGIIRGALHGVPVAVKDLMDVAGYPNSCGTGARRNGPIATETAAAARALIDAGAVVVGLTNLHEWAYGGTSENPHFGAVRNPWDPSRIPGGSSGGSAVAVSTGMSFVALGTDTGGSVRIPASLTGTAGLKVTVGRVSTRGVHPLSWTLDTVGPMARRVSDLETPFRVLASTGKGRAPAVRRHRMVPGLRIGIDRSYYLEEGRVQPPVYDAVARVLDWLKEVGAEVLDVSIPSLRHAAAAQYAILLAEASSIHSDRALRNRYGDDVRRYLAFGDLVPAQDYIAALRFRETLYGEFQRVLADVDFLISPTTPFVASPIGATEVNWPNGSSEALLDAIWRCTFPSNLVGIPSLSFPCGWSGEGLPVGLQLIGPPQSELALLDVGRRMEAEFAGEIVPPTVRGAREGRQRA